MNFESPLSRYRENCGTEKRPEKLRNTREMYPWCSTCCKIFNSGSTEKLFPFGHAFRQIKNQNRYHSFPSLKNITILIKITWGKTYHMKTDKRVNDECVNLESICLATINTLTTHEWRLRKIWITIYIYTHKGTRASLRNWWTLTLLILPQLWMYSITVTANNIDIVFDTVT